MVIVQDVFLCYAQEMLTYLNGTYLRDEEAKIPVSDLGLVRGYGVFDYLRTYNGQPFRLWDHLLRLKSSAEQIGLHVPNTLEEIQKIVEELLEKNGYKESSIKIIVTGGISADQLLPEKKSSLIIMVYPFKAFPKEHYNKGIKIISTRNLRPFPAAKTTNYIAAIFALQQAREKGAQDALYVNAQEQILETTTSNFFGFKDGVLITSASDEILLGITREVVLSLALFPIEIRPILYSEKLDEAFITSSNKEIVPVVQIDEMIIGKGVVGENTKKVMSSFQDAVRLKDRV